MDRNIDLNLLVALDAVLAERNVTRAARRLNLSQPALSAQLARLRDLFGDPLLIPAQRGMIPTQRALDLQEPLRRALEEVRGVIAAGARFDPAVAELTVSIVASDYVQYAVLMPLSFTLAREAPGLRLAFRTIDVAHLTAQMERGEVDLAVITPQVAPERLRLRPLYEERYVTIARRDHPRIAGTLDADTFCALEHVIVSPGGGGFSGPADAALAAHGRSRRVAMSVQGFMMVPEIVARSDMIALVPERLVHGRAERLQVFEPPVPVPGFTIAMVWHDRTTGHPAQRWLRDRVMAIGRGVAVSPADGPAGMV
ncbi:LysR family transcriptional regulator [Azospirillum halopraeferens]|uniref:LysR family transcriptional regulator n=1 Tax=Azospirillum halopraeferens TaxID=34010 RepID=UPI00041E8304|nr:LysR family transcriptional regulator [Azospirillum halopraeferens]